MMITIDDVNTYTAYKPSGVEWLGDIPEHWEVRRIKYLFEEINERSFNGEEDLLSVSQYTGVTKKKADDIDNGDFITSATTLEGYKKVDVNDLVSNIMLAWNGSLGFSPHSGITSPAYSVYRLNSPNEHRYFHYLLRTDLYKAEFKRNSSGVIESRLRLYTEDFFRILAIIPPLSEQTAIAQFLDSKTALIDKAIALKEKQIALLKEHQQAIIHQSVTNGLNPDAPLKNSGIDWIGEIPAHWGVKKAKFTFKKMEQGWSPQCDNYVAEIDEWGVLKVGCVNGFDFNPFENKVLPTSLKPKLEYQIKQGDILISRANTIELVGSTAFVKEIKHRLLLCDKLYRVHINQEKIDPEFYIFLLKTSYARSHIEIHASGASPTMQNIGQDCIKDMLLFLPDIEEQKKIVSYLKRVLKKISVSISSKEKEIEKLKEYKTSLINSAVTGKIKVA